MWTPNRQGKFKKQFKKLEHTLQDKTNDAIKELLLSDDPRLLGDFKKSMNVYAYRLDKSNRIIYDVDFFKKTIDFMRVGDHKSTYGSD